MKTTKAMASVFILLISLVVFPSAAAFAGWEDGWSSGWGDGWSSGWGDGWSSGWGDSWSSGWDDGASDGWSDSDDDIEDIPSDPVDYPDDNTDYWPAYWNKLDDKSVPENSPDYTIVYPNLRNMCVSSSGANVIIASHAPQYDLEMRGNDLVIRNLQMGYHDNGNIVALSCNGAASFFRLTITESESAPSIVGLDEIIVYIHEDLSINLERHEYDPDSAPSQLSWFYTARWDSFLKFSVSLEGKTLRIHPRALGSSEIKLRLVDSTGLFEEKKVPVRVVRRDSPAPQPAPSDDEPSTGLFVSSIRISTNSLNAGDELNAFITVKNSGEKDLEDVKVAMVIQDLSARGAAGPFDLKKGRTMTIPVRIFIDSDAVISQNVYDARFTISNGDARRVVYREIDVETD